MLFNLSKRKFIILLISAILLLSVSVSFVLAYTGYFPQLAKILNIKADVTPSSIPQTYTVCGAGISSTHNVNGVYQYDPVKSASFGSPVYSYKAESVSKTYYIYLGPNYGWSISTALGDNAPGYISPFNNKDPVPPSFTNAIWGYQPAWPSPGPKVVTGIADVKTCAPLSGGYIFGKVTDAASNSYLAGVTMTISPAKGEPVTTTAVDQYNGWLPNNYWITTCPFLPPTAPPTPALPNETYQVTATKTGYAPQTKTAVVNNNMPQLDFVLSDIAGAPAKAILGYVYDENSNLLSGIKVNVYQGQSPSSTLIGSCVTGSSCMPPLPNLGNRNYYIPIDSKYSSPYSVEFVDPSNNRILSQYSYDSFPMADYYETGHKLIIWDSQFKDYMDTRFNPSRYYKLGYLNAKMTTEGTIIQGQIYDKYNNQGNPILSAGYDPKFLKVYLKPKGFKRPNPFDKESFIQIMRVDFPFLDTIPDEGGKYRFQITPGTFNSLSDGSDTMSAEICAWDTRSTSIGCYGTIFLPINPTLLTIQKGNTYSNIDIFLQPQTLDYKIQYLSAVDGSPIDLEKEAVITNKLVPTAYNNNIIGEPFPSQLDNTDVTHSTYIYYVVSMSSLTDYSLSFETTNYKLVPFEISLSPNINPVKVYLTPKSNQGDAYYCEMHCGVWFVSYKAKKDEIFTPARRAIMDQMGRLYTQLHEASGSPWPLPTIMIGGTNSASQFYDNINVNADCIENKRIIDFNVDRIDNMDVGTWVHELGHDMDSHIGLPGPFGVTPAWADSMFAIQKAAQVANCKQYGYPCFSKYGLTANWNEMWADFFSTYITEMDSINKALADPNVSKPCKFILRLLINEFNVRFPNMPVFAKTGDALKTSTPCEGGSGNSIQALSTTTTSSYDKSALVSIMKNLGYTETAVPITKTSISNDALLALTPTQILAGKWLQENYDKLTLIQKANFQLGVISSQVSAWANNNTAISYIRTQIINMSATIEGWLGKLGFNFTSSRLTGTLLDQNSNGVSGFKVTVGNAAGQGKFDITNLSSNFSIPRLPTGDQIITVTNPKDGKTYPVFDYNHGGISASQFTVKPATNYTKTLMIYR